MKVNGVNGVSPPQGAQRAGGSAAPGFAPAASAVQRVAPMSGVAPTTSLESILALQGDGAPDRRRHQARRGKRLLDTLDRLTRALLEGVAPAGLRRELTSLSAQAECTGDQGLDEILLEIDTRAAVELAKLEKLAAPA